MTEGARKELTACIVAIAKNEARYIREWTSYHLGLGFDRIHLYDNESEDGLFEIASAMAPRVAVTWWPTIEGVSPQLTAYDHARLTLQHKYDFLAFIDLDEFFSLAELSNIKDYLATVPEDVGAIAVNQKVFGSSGLKAYEPAPVLERFRRCARADYPEHIWFKSIYRGGAIASITGCHQGAISHGRYVNSLFEDGAIPQRSRTNHPCFSVIQLNHYVLKSEDEFLQKRERGDPSANTAETRRARYADMTAFFHRRNTAANEETDTRALELARMMEAAPVAPLRPLPPLPPHASQDRPLSDEESRELLAIRHRTDINFETIVEEIYSQTVRPGDTVLDGGAHVGRHTLPLAALVGETGAVIGVEPVRRFLDVLTQRKMEAGLSNIVLHQCALYDEETELNSGGNSGDADRLPPFPPDIELLTVEIAAIDALCEGPVTFLRLDLKGDEYRALKGAAKTIARSLPLIVIEKGEASAPESDYTGAEWFELLESYGYFAVDLFGRRFDLSRWTDKTVPPYDVLMPKKKAYYAPIVWRSARKVLRAFREIKAASLESQP